MGDFMEAFGSDEDDMKMDETLCEEKEYRENKLVVAEIAQEEFTMYEHQDSLSDEQIQSEEKKVTEVLPDAPSGTDVDDDTSEYSGEIEQLERMETWDSVSTACETLRGGVTLRLVQEFYET